MASLGRYTSGDWDVSATLFGTVGPGFLITLKDGEVQPLGRARSRAQALDRLVALLERDGSLSRLAVLHGGARADAERLRERVAPHYPGLDISFAETGPVLGTHTGPGVIGFTYLLA